MRNTTYGLWINMTEDTILTDIKKDIEKYVNYYMGKVMQERPNFNPSITRKLIMEKVIEIFADQLTKEVTEYMDSINETH